MLRSKGSEENVLIARFSALGDIAMTIPSVYNACRANPGRHFFFLTRQHPSALFINAPHNLTVVSVDLSKYKGPAGMARLATELHQRYHIDLFIDLHDVLRTQLLRFFLLLKGVASYKINKGRREKKRLTRRKNKHLLPLTPTAERYDDTFRRAGLPLDSSFRSIFDSESEKSELSHSPNQSEKGDPKEFAAVTPPKKEDEYWLAIAPFAKHKGKIYPLDQLKKVVDHFAAKPEARIFIFGFGKEEEAEIERLGGGAQNVVNMAKVRIGIPGELALLSHCDAMLSMDSFNMHLASLTGLRTVSIWGATHPYTGFMGRGQNPEDALQLDMTCRPCSVFGDKPCLRGDYHCLSGISPRAIIEKLEKK